MSRNLAQTNCAECPAPRVCLIEPPRPGTKEDFFAYDKEFGGMMVADAECPLCGARYLAWVDQRTITATGRYASEHRAYGCHAEGDLDYFDLSYKSTFDDEPGDEDTARYNVEIQYVRRPLDF